MLGSDDFLISNESNELFLLTIIQLSPFTKPQTVTKLFLNDFLPLSFNTLLMVSITQ